MKKKIVLALGLALTCCVFMLTGCGNNETEPQSDTGSLEGWDYIQAKGELVVGLDDTFAPMGFRDTDGNLVGFDIDLAEAVGKELGVKVKFTPIDWDSKEMELSSKRIDCIWNGMSATPERQEKMALTDKYLNNKIIVLGKDETVKVAKVEDLTKYKIGTQADSAALEVMQGNDSYSAFADNVTEYKTYDEAIMDLQTGRIDCMVVDQVLGEYKNSKLSKKLVLCDFDFGDDFYAIGCRVEDKDVAAKITEGLQAVIDNGEAQTISEKWFGRNIVILEGYDK